MIGISGTDSLNSRLDKHKKTLRSVPGSGLQTLGEEYCDIYQVNSCGEFPGGTRRLVLATLEARRCRLNR
jgi:hypothetical protein